MAGAAATAAGFGVFDLYAVLATVVLAGLVVPDAGICIIIYRSGISWASDGSPQTKYDRNGQN